MIGGEYGLIPLIPNLQSFNYDAAFRILGMISLFAGCYRDTNRVIQKHRTNKTQTIIAVTHGFGIYLSGGHAHAYAENQRSVSHTLTKTLFLAPLRVHMVRVEVPGLPGVQHNICFCDGAAHSLTLDANCIVFKENVFFHKNPDRIELLSSIVFAHGRDIYI